MDAREREKKESIRDCVIALFEGNTIYRNSSRASLGALRKYLNDMVAVQRWLRSSEGQRATGFWMSGLLNNSNFVIMNAGAKSIAAGG